MECRSGITREPVAVSSPRIHVHFRTPISIRSASTRSGPVVRYAHTDCIAATTPANDGVRECGGASGESLPGGNWGWLIAQGTRHSLAGPVRKGSEQLKNHHAAVSLVWKTFDFPFYDGIQQWVWSIDPSPHATMPTTWDNW